MYQKFMALIMTITILFLTQSQVWASVKPVNTEMEVNYTMIDKNFSFISDTSFETARNNIPRARAQSHNIAWVGSIFIMGLGQWLMGDFWRGFRFYVWSVLAVLISLVLTIAIIGPFLIEPALLAIYIWNIMDAYNMSMEGDLLEAGSSEKLAVIEKRITEILKVAERVSTSDNKINYQILSF